MQGGVQNFLSGIYRFFRRLVMGVFRLLGSEVCDARSGEVLGKALLLPWKGKVLVLGAESRLWIPIPLPQKELNYWKQEIGFTLHDGWKQCAESAVDRMELRTEVIEGDTDLLLVVLDHRSPQIVELGLAERLWSGFKEENILLIYGGVESDFFDIAWSNKRFVGDLRLRTRQHIREKQSYRGVFEEVVEWMKNRDITHILFMESDHIGMVGDLGMRYLCAMREQKVDVLGYQVRRMDRTIHPHWLGAVIDTYEEKEVWSMLGTGHFWKREVWEAVTADKRYEDWYLELDMPTTAVELGFKIGRVEGQDEFVVDLPRNLQYGVKEAKQAGAWTLHPVKNDRR